MSNGIYALEQVGELNQIRLGSEISQNIREEFKRMDESRMDETFVLHYKSKHQMWFFFPYLDKEYFHTIWIKQGFGQYWNITKEEESPDYTVCSLSELCDIL